MPNPERSFLSNLPIALCCLLVCSFAGTVSVCAAPLKGQIKEYGTGTAAGTASTGINELGAGSFSGSAGSNSLDGSADSNTLQGTASETRLQGGSSPSFLEGGIKDEASLRPSLKVIKGAPDWATGNQFPLKIQQFSGGREYTPGQPAPALARPTPQWPWSSRRTFHQIPPISSYTLMPRNGVMTYQPGLEISPSVRDGVMTFTPGFSVSSVRSGTSHGHGITTFDTDTHVADVVTHSGVTSWMPGFGTRPEPGQLSAWISKTPFTHSGVTSFLTGEENTIYSASAATSRLGRSEYVSTSRKGVSCWSPGYEVSVSSTGMTKETLGGMWSVPATRPEDGLVATAKGIPAPQYFVQPVLESPLIAKAETLPGIEVGAVTWEQWYKTVARAIYSRWRYAEVGPGVATVRVTVLRSREMSARVVDFVPALGVERNAAEEKSFREAALKAVNSVYNYEIPEFPKTSDNGQVTFNVEMKRTVDGDAGFDVSSGRTD